MSNFLGWVLGVLLGALLVLIVFTSLGLPLAPLLALVLAVIPASVSSSVASIAASLGGNAVTWGLTAAVLMYLWAYVVATASIAGSLPAVTFPLAANVSAPGTAPVRLPAASGELFARGFMIGLTAVFNASLIGLLPSPVAAFISWWAFALVSLAAAPPVSRNRVFQGFLGWSAWLFPVSYPATAVGLLLFVLNALPALAGLGMTAFRIDWTTGALETAGGITGVTGFSGGFSLGNFNFLTPGVAQASFTTPGVPSHETGHTLNTAALGGVVLWINAVDENVFPRRMNLAYGELTAESHTVGLPGTPRPAFFVGIWG